MHQNRETTLKDYQLRVFETMNYISDHADKNLSLEEIAQIAHFLNFGRPFSFGTHWNRLLLL